MFRKLLDQGSGATTSGCCCAGIDKDDVERGRCWRSRLDHAAHEVQGFVYVYVEGRGGRHSAFFKATGRSSTSARRRDGRDGTAEGVEMVMPGDNVTIGVEADHAGGHGQGLRFASARAPDVGAGTVTEILQ